MLEITLKRAGKRLMKEPIGERPVTIGRSAENTLRLLDPEISRNHCRIEWKDGALRAIDLSSNGILINGEPMEGGEINAGDQISIGPWTLVIDTRIDAVPVKTLVSEPHATRVLAYDPARRKLATQRMEVLVHTPDQAPLRKRIAKQEVTIGHHGSCDIAVADPYVSRRHCKLVIGDGRVKLVDTGSTNGVFVGGTRVAQASMQAHGAFTIGRSAVHYRLITETEEIRPVEKARLGKMIGVSAKMREVFGLIERIAPSDAAVLITGESGTGKELAAREIHRLSNRRSRPFVAVNCGSIPANIIESQLFGHERGAFTGAVERAAGLFEQAAGGTVLLDEIGEMPLEMQTRLLRVIESKSVRRVGGHDEIPVDFRLVCATHRNLSRMAKEGRFRDDLLFRIFVVPVEMPPLRERPEDTLVMAREMIAGMSAEGRTPSFTDAALKALADHDWPGNARELRNTIERTLLLCDHDVIEAGDIRFAGLESPPAEGDGLKDRERTYIVEALGQCGGNITDAAKRLGIARTTLQAKIKRYGIEAKGREGAQ